jgi:hypothetical protein
MRAVSKVWLVVGGYVLAGVVAWLVTALYIAVTPSVDRQAYGGMSAFGDSLLFLAVFGVAAVPVTGAALYFLRGWPRFWTVISVASLCVAVTAVAAVLAYVSWSPAAIGSARATWSAVAPIRILVAPLFTGLFALAAIFAPSRAARMRLMAAAVIEAVTFVCLLIVWMRPMMAR